MNEKTFDRIEKKYLIDVGARKRMLDTIKKKMEKDQYFKSEIFNLYFDTDNYDLIIKSIDDPDFKEKLRARAYSGYDRVFLEIKTKLRENGISSGHKRRFMVTRQDFKKLVAKKKTAEELALDNGESINDAQIAREIDYLISYLELKPRLLVYYSRKSYVGEDGLRITFDENLSYRENDLDFRQKTRDKHYFDDEKNIIMEVKTLGAMPLWLVEVLSKNKIYPERFSKVGKIYEKIRKEQNV